MAQRAVTKAEVARTALAVAVLAASVVLLGLAFFAPLYTDEITWKHFLARTLFEGGRYASLGPQCPQSLTAPLPAAFAPAALVYAIAFSGLGLLGLKISGVVLAVAWLARGFRILVPSPAGSAWGFRRLASLAAFQLVGVVPLTLAMARFEPLLLHCIAGYVTFPLFAPIDTLTTRRGRVGALLAFLLLTSVFFFGHPKTLYFTPLVIVSALLTFSPRARPAFFAIALGFSLLAAAEGVRVAREMMPCDEFPLVTKRLEQYTLGPHLAFTEPLTFLRAGTSNVHHRILDVADSMTLQVPSPGNWLPAVTITPLVEAGNVATRAVIHALQFGAWLLALASLPFVRDTRVRRRIVLAVTLEVCLLGHLFTAVNFAFYMAGLLVGVPILVVWLAGSALREVLAERTKLRLRPLVTAGELTLQIAALFSAFVTLRTLGPPLVRLSRFEGALIPDQPSSAPIFGAARERARIRAHAERCGLRGDGSTHLVVDEVTLFAFDRLRHPFILVNSTDTSMWGVDFPGTKNLELLRRLGVPGIIARCVGFPSALVGRIQRAGDYCCVGAKDLELAELPKGKRITFGVGGGGGAYLRTGWGWEEERGRWTKGSIAELAFASSAQDDVAGIDLQMTASFDGPRQVQDVKVALNGVSLGTVRLTPTDNDPSTLRYVPIAAPARLQANNLLTLEPSDVRSAKELGIDGDDQPLGIHLYALQLNPELRKLRKGERIGLGIGGTGGPLFRAGWSWPEAQGRWSIGSASDLVFAVQPGEGVAAINLQMAPPLGEGRESQEVEVTLNGVVLERVRLSCGDADVTRPRRFAIAPPAGLLSRNVLTLRPSDLRSSKELGTGSDERPIGVYVSALWLD